MRVTEQQLYNSSTLQIVKGWERLAKVQEQISSGRRISKPSDDPLAAATIGALDESLRKIKDCDSARNTANMLMQGAESALGQAVDMFIRVREMAVQANNGAFGSTGRIGLALELRELKKQLVSLSNTETQDRYVFAGFNSATAPFQADGTFGGDENELSLEISPNLQVKATLNGSAIFNGVVAGVQQGENLFDVLESFATALDLNDTAAIGVMLPQIDRAFAQVNRYRTEAGNRQQTLELASGYNANLKLDTTKNKGYNQDTDVVGASMELALAQQALQASMATIPKMLAQSIIDRL